MISAAPGWAAPVARRKGAYSGSSQTAMSGRLPNERIRGVAMFIGPDHMAIRRPVMATSPFAQLGPASLYLLRGSALVRPGGRPAQLGGARQVVETLQSHPLEEFPRRAVEHGPAERVVAAGDADELPVH